MSWPAPFVTLAWNGFVDAYACSSFGSAGDSLHEILLCSFALALGLKLLGAHVGCGAERTSCAVNVRSNAVVGECLRTASVYCGRASG